VHVLKQLAPQTKIFINNLLIKEGNQSQYNLLAASQVLAVIVTVDIELMTT